MKSNMHASGQRRRPEIRPMAVRRAGQRGVVMFIALIVLVAMTLAGIAMVRSVDTGNLIAGNLMFKGATVGAGDRGIEAARDWLKLQTSADLNADAPANGYYATWQEGVDLTGHNTAALTDNVSWDGGAGMATPVTLSADSAGNTPAYVIHRMCSKILAATDDDRDFCATNIVTSNRGSIKDVKDYILQPGGTRKKYYRVTVWVAGPKNTTTFVQTMLMNQ